MGKLVDITGNRFGRLTAVKKSETVIGNKILWVCLCDCGKECVVNIQSLKTSNTRSCGCLQRDSQKERRIDLTGKKFAKLLVIERGDKIGKGQFWKCLCDCGNETHISGNSLVRGNTRSCGCLHKEAMLRKKIEGFGPEKTKYLREYRNSASSKGRVFELSEEFFHTITQKSCHYCGTSPKTERRRKVGREPYLCNGIDRKDNNEGYTETNSLPCCSLCNYAKRSMTYDEFICWIKSVSKHLNL